MRPTFSMPELDARLWLGVKPVDSDKLPSACVLPLTHVGSLSGTLPLDPTIQSSKCVAGLAGDQKGTSHQRRPLQGGGLQTMVGLARSLLLAPPIF